MEHSGLDELKGRIFNPSLMLAAPFLPYLVYTNIPASALLLLFFPLSYFSTVTKYLRKNVPNFTAYYISIFVGCLLSRLALEFLPIYFWAAPIIILPFIMVAWGKYSWSNWRKVYESIQRA